MFSISVDFSEHFTNALHHKCAFTSISMAACLGKWLGCYPIGPLQMLFKNSIMPKSEILKLAAQIPATAKPANLFIPL